MSDGSATYERKPYNAFERWLVRSWILALVPRPARSWPLLWRYFWQADEVARIHAASAQMAAEMRPFID